MMCRVYVRVKPLSAEEVAVGHTSVLKCQDGHRLQCTALGSVKVHFLSFNTLHTAAWSQMLPIGHPGLKAWVYVV